MRRDAHNVRKTLKKVQNASRMYVLDMCGYKKWVLQPQFTYRQPPQAHSAHSNMGGSEALTIKGGLLILRGEQRVQHKRNMPLEASKLKQILRRHDHQSADRVKTIGA